MNIGYIGEAVAAIYLERVGWYIRERNWRYNNLEIDLIAIDESDTILLFVEVKTRSSVAYGDPLQAVDAEKRKNISRAAARYKVQMGKENREIRYDVITIIIPDNLNENILNSLPYNLTRFSNSAPASNAQTNGVGSSTPPVFGNMTDGAVSNVVWNIYDENGEVVNYMFITHTENAFLMESIFNL